LFDPKYDKFVYVNNEGYIENTIVFSDINCEVDDYDYDSTIINLLLENLEGLEILSEGNLVYVFRYNGVNFLMCLYASIDFDSVYFVLSLQDKVSGFNESKCEDELDC
jgi:hypothetical protein